MLEELHISHPGIQRMKLLARSHVWWPYIDQDIQEMVKGCCACQELKHAPPVAPLHPWIWPSQPWKRINVDFAGPFMGGSHLIVVDAHSKWPERPRLFKFFEVYWYGIPEQLVSDNGPQLYLKSLGPLCSSLGSNTLSALRITPHSMVKQNDLFLLSSKQFKLARGKESLWNKGCKKF